MAAEPDAGADTPAQPPTPHAWYAGDTNFTTCIQSRSPADRLEELRHLGADVSAKDIIEDGQMTGVEIGISEGLQERYWTYYVSKEICERKLAASNAIPDAYR